MNSPLMNTLTAALLAWLVLPSCVKPSPKPTPEPEPEKITPAILSVSLPVYPQAEITINDELEKDMAVLDKRTVRHEKEGD